MIAYRVGMSYPTDGASGGIQVVVDSNTLAIAVVGDDRDSFVRKTMEGRFQIGFLNTPPFGWFFVNNEGGFADACWSLGRVPDDIRPAVSGFLERTLAEIDPTKPVQETVPPTVMLAVSTRTQTVIGIRPVFMKPDSWVRMVTTLLDHRQDLNERQFAYWQKRWEDKLESRSDFQGAKELLWVDTFEAS
jgi:hypothetical protein